MQTTIEDSVKAYLLQEDMPNRAGQDVVAKMKGILGPEKTDIINSSVKADTSYAGIRPSTYELLSTPVNGTCAYDYFKSRHYDLLVWRISEATKVLRDKNPRHLLDIGCADGLEACFYGENLPQLDVLGVDISHGMINMANRRASKRDLLNCRFYEADRDNLPFTEESFDALTCINALTECTPDVNSSNNLHQSPIVHNRLREFSRVLGKDGTFVLFQPSSADKIDQYESENRARLVEAGFNVEDVKHYTSKLNDSKHASIMFVARKG